MEHALVLYKEFLTTLLFQKNLEIEFHMFWKLFRTAETYLTSNIHIFFIWILFGVIMEFFKSLGHALSNEPGISSRFMLSMMEFTKKYKFVSVYMSKCATPPKLGPMGLVQPRGVCLPPLPPTYIVAYTRVLFIQKLAIVATLDLLFVSAGPEKDHFLEPHYLQYFNPICISYCYLSCSLVACLFMVRLIMLLVSSINFKRWV